MQAPNWTEFLQCSVCTGKYNCSTAIPVSLSCNHTMCKRCITRLKTKQCPYDRTAISPNTETFPPNTALLLLLGYQPDNWSHEMLNICPTVVPDTNLEGYTSCREAVENLALFLKPFTDQGVLQATASIPRPMLRKLVSLLCYQLLDGEGRARALRSAHSIAERMITELLIMHQNQQQISSLLWTAVRARGCQFLGPVMQEETLKLILKVLESGCFLSRKNIVLYAVHRLVPDFPNASKTNVGHVVQLLYRASCFNVEKREDESSLMQLKEEYRSYESLRREHDAQIIKIAMEAGLRITPETWSTQLYGNTCKKSDMQSIIDKLVSQGVASSGLSELIVAVGRSQDPYNLSEKLIPHLDALLKINVGVEKSTEKAEVTEAASWESYANGIEELLTSLQVFTEFTQIQSGRYKTGMCPYLAKPGGCPRGTLCGYAHSEEERKKYVNIAKTSTKRVKPRGDTSRPLTQPPPLHTSNMPMIPHRSDSSGHSEEFVSAPLDGGSPFHSLDETFATYPGGTVLYHSQSDPQMGPTFIMQPGGIPPTTPLGPQGYYNPAEFIPQQYSREFLYDSGYNGVMTGRDASLYSNTDSNDRSQFNSVSLESTSSNSSSYLNEYDPNNDHTYPINSHVNSQKTHSGQLSVNMGGTNADSTDSTPVTTSQLYPPTSIGDSPPASIATTLAADAWKYRQKDTVTSSSDSSLEMGGRVSLSEGESLPTSTVVSEVYSHTGQPSALYSTAEGTVVSEGGDNPVSTVPSVSSPMSFDQLNARIKALEDELRRRDENNHSRELPPNGPPPRHHHQIPSPYYTSPHNSGFIGHVTTLPSHYQPHPGHMPPVHQASPTPQFFQPGLPGNLPGHPWTPPIAPMGIPADSPHSTPPNTGLIVPVIPHHMGPHHFMPSVTPPQHRHHIPPHLHHQPPPQRDLQVQHDEYLAHYLQFMEQSRATGVGTYSIAPGAHLSSNHHPPPVNHPPISYQGFPYGNVIAAKTILK